MSVTLRSDSWDEVTLEQALARWPESLPVGLALAYSPEACRFATLRQGHLVGSRGPLRLPSIFEARVFHPQAELRWLHSSGDRGRAVLLREGDTAEGSDSGEDGPEVLATCERTYLLWGQGTGATEADGQPLPQGWSLLAEHRIGALAVPCADIPPQGQACLVAREYLGRVDEYGNVGVLEERLCELRAAAVFSKREVAS